MSFDPFMTYLGFDQHVILKKRYRLDAQYERFIECVVESTVKRVTAYSSGCDFWRAQSGCDEEFVPNQHELDGSLYGPSGPRFAYPPARMKPIPNRAKEGRANPKGIPFLYLATDRNTAMSEMRAWIGAYLSLARFVTTRDIRLVDCTLDGRPEDWKDFMDIQIGDRERAVWMEINDAFSEPVTPTDDTAHYAPTQIIAEALRTAGYDGLIYNSRVGEGKNVVLFDLTAAEVKRHGDFACTGVHRVTKVVYEFE